MCEKSIREYEKLEFCGKELRVYETPSLYHSVPLKEAVEHAFREDVHHEGMNEYEPLFEFIRPKPRRLIQQEANNWFSNLCFVVVGCADVCIITHGHDVELKPQVKVA